MRIFMDDSTSDRKNFEMGANKTHFHSINVNFDRDLDLPDKFYDFKTAKEGDLYPETREKYEVYKAAEIGNIFPLNTKFSKAFGFTYTDSDGKEKPIYMGSYGLGSSRVMGVLVEKFADDNGLVWNKNVSPFDVHLISIKSNDKAEKVYKKLQDAGVEVLYDDREDVSAGNQFADADLIGIPVRLVVSTKSGDKVEWKERTSKDAELLTFGEVLQKLGK